MSVNILNFEITLLKNYLSKLIDKKNAIQEKKIKKITYKDISIDYIELLDKESFLNREIETVKEIIDIRVNEYEALNKFQK